MRKNGIRNLIYPKVGENRDKRECRTIWSNKNKYKIVELNENLLVT